MISTAQLVVVACVCCTTFVFGADKLPSSWDRCPVSPDLDNKPNECLIKAISGAVNELTDNGAPELGALDLDPMQIGYIKIQRGADSPVAVTLIFKNNTLAGLSGFSIREVNGKLSSADGFRAEVKAKTPYMILTGPYKISGKILVLPIQGEGLSNITLTDINIFIVINGKSQTKNGKQYLDVTSITLSMDIGRMYLNLGNLFNGNKALGDNTNMFLNNNWKDIYNELRPSIEEAFGAVYKEYARRIFSQVPFGDVFIQQ